MSRGSSLTLSTLHFRIRVNRLLLTREIKIDQVYEKKGNFDLLVSETGVVRILVIFQDRPMFSHINGKL